MEFKIDRQLILGQMKVRYGLFKIRVFKRNSDMRIFFYYVQIANI